MATSKHIVALKVSINGFTLYKSESWAVTKDSIPSRCNFKITFVK